SIANPVAQLLNSGNFVIRGANDSNAENYLWQSFDYPTDTLLPGMKHGINFVTGIDRQVSPWKTTSDPSRGDTIFRMDPRGFPQQLLLTNSIEQFRSGPWNGLRFSGSPGLKPNPLYTYEFVFNKKEVYYMFELINSSVYSRLTLNTNGVLQRSTWNYRTQEWVVYLNVPADNCDHYALCHAYGSCSIGNSPVCGCLDKFVPKFQKDWDRADWSSGCVRKTPLDCEKGDGFFKYSGVKLPDTRNSWFNESMTLDECHKVCLDNCTCMAFANLDVRAGGSGCLLWFGDLVDIRQLVENGQDIYIRMAFSELSTHDESNRKKGEKIKIILPLLAGMLLVGLSLTLYVWKRKKKQKKQQQELLNREGRTGHSSEQYYTKSILVAATMNKIQLAIGLVRVQMDRFTSGYMSPEYAVDGHFSVKSDVFSFGVLVLEIVSGKRNRGFFHQDHHHNLLGHAWILFNKGRSLELIDAHMGDSCYLSEVLRSIHVTLLCVQQSPEDRPSMSSVVLMLGGEGTLPQPKEPGFFTKRNLFFEADTSSSNNAAMSVNDISITLLDAR
ncbi:hypothetical protein RJ639_035176, partial [Escallonia herrerae]